MPWFRLRRIDKVTMCFTHEVHFETNEVGRVMDIIDTNQMSAGDFHDLMDGEYAALVERFELDLPEVAEFAEIFWHHNDNFDRRPTHTGRELLLMLEGRKPFTAFIDEVFSRDQGIIPEDLFEPYVAAGRFSKRVVLKDLNLPGKLPVPVRRVMYAATGEEWRFDAFISLWDLAEKYGWNDGFEKMEGFLYGYETEVDPFFVRANQTPLQALLTSAIAAVTKREVP